MLHGLLPDEHTWPITFSYALGGASGKQGLRAGFYFSLAFTIQRAMLSQVAYFVLTPVLAESYNWIVFLLVGAAMAAAGALLLYRNWAARLRRLVHRHGRVHEIAEAELAAAATGAKVVPVKWTLIHGFIAGFGFEGFVMYINLVCTPAMPSPWLGFLPGLLFGLGTMVVLMALGTLFGASLRRVRSLTEEEITRIGSDTGARTLFYGGLVFAAFGMMDRLGWTKRLPVEEGYLLMGVFMGLIAVPAFIYSWRQVKAARGRVGPEAISETACPE
jgi:sulfite exporter TauE/SafE